MQALSFLYTINTPNKKSRTLAFLRGYLLNQKRRVGLFGGLRLRLIAPYIFIIQSNSVT
jgi:hypothetical protein